MADNKEFTRLIRKAMAGDDVAFGELYQRVARDILWQVSFMLVKKEDVEDVAQEVVIRLYKNIKNLKSPYAFQAYLSRVVVSVCAVHNSKGSLPQEDVDEIAEVAFAPDAEGPEAQIEQAEKSREICSVIANLPEKQRDVVFLHYYRDLSYTEVAKALGVGISTVGSNMVKAKRAIRKQLGEAIPAPAIVLSLTEGARLQVPDANVAHFVGSCKQLLASQQVAIAASGSAGAGAGAGAGSASHGVGGFAALAGGLLGLALLSGAFVLYGLQLKDADAVAATRSPAVPLSVSAFEPDVSIVFAGLAGDDPAESFSAHLEVVDAQADGWVVLDADGSQLRRGSGLDAENLRQGLAPGTYTIMWEITNPEGHHAQVSATFTAG